MLVLGSLTTLALAIKGTLAVGSPFGYATGTTGGAAVAQAIPSSAAELKSWWAHNFACIYGIFLTELHRLEDSTTRNILLDKTYDFTDTEVRFSIPSSRNWPLS